MGQEDVAKEAAQQVQFNLTQKRARFPRISGPQRDPGGSRTLVGRPLHDTSEKSTGIASDAGSKPYEFGDTLNLDIPETLKRAIEREGLKVPLELEYKDLMVHQTELPVVVPPRS